MELENDLPESRSRGNCELDEWHDVSGPGHTFSYMPKYAQIADSLPGSEGRPNEFYSIFLNDDLLQCMVNETKVNAHQNLAGNNASANSRLANWQDTDVNEMKKFIGILIWMGLVKLPTIANYWSNDALYRNGIASTVMTRNRFQLLLRMWHLAITMTKWQYMIGFTKFATS
jgi:hypothetical protein